MAGRRLANRRPVEHSATNHVAHGFVDVEFVVVLRITIAHAIETADGRVARREVPAARRPNDDGFTHVESPRFLSGILPAARELACPRMSYVVQAPPLK